MFQKHKVVSINFTFNAVSFTLAKAKPPFLLLVLQIQNFSRRDKSDTVSGLL